VDLPNCIQQPCRRCWIARQRTAAARVERGGRRLDGVRSPACSTRHTRPAKGCCSDVVIHLRHVFVGGEGGDNRNSRRLATGLGLISMRAGFETWILMPCGLRMPMWHSARVLVPASAARQHPPPAPRRTGVHGHESICITTSGQRGCVTGRVASICLSMNSLRPVFAATGRPRRAGGARLGSRHVAALICWALQES